MGRDRWSRSVMCALVTLSVACSSGHPSSARPTTTTSGSKTPHITVGSKGPLGGGLLTTADLRAVAGLPADVTVAELSDLSVYADPDPRGPCGAKVPVLDLATGAGVGITSASAQGVELIVRTDDATAKAYLDARAADARAGCPEYQTTTNRGEVQKVRLDRVIPLLVAADQSLATQRAILVADKVTSVTLIELRRAGTLAKVAIFAATPPPVATVQALAARAAEDLARVA